MPAARGRGQAVKSPRASARRGRSIKSPAADENETKKDEPVTEDVAEDAEEEADEEVDEEAEDSTEKDLEEMLEEDQQEQEDEEGEPEEEEEAADEEEAEEDAEGETEEVEEEQEEGDEAEEVDEEAADEEDAEEAMEEETEDGGADAEHEGHNGEDAEYCVVDEVEGDAEQDAEEKPAETKKSPVKKAAVKKAPAVAKKATPAKTAPAKTASGKTPAKATPAKKAPAKKAPAKKAAAKTKAGTAKKDDAKSEKKSKEEKEAEEKEKEPKLPETYGFLPTYGMFQRDMGQFAGELKVFSGPMSVEEMENEVVAELIKKARFSTVALFTKDTGPEKFGMLKLCFLTMEDAKSAEETLKEHCKEGEVTRCHAKVTKEVLQNWNRKISEPSIGGTPDGFQQETTVAVYHDTFTEWKEEDVKTAFPSTAKIYIPQFPTGKCKRYFLVGLSSKEEVTEFVDKKSVQIGERICRVMGFKQTPAIKPLIQKIMNLKLQNRLMDVMPSGLIQYYLELQEQLQYFINWANQRECANFNRDTLIRFKNQINNKLHVSKKIEENKTIEKKRREESAAANKKRAEERRKSAGGKDTDDKSKVRRTTRPERPTGRPATTPTGARKPFSPRPAYPGKRPYEDTRRRSVGDVDTKRPRYDDRYGNRPQRGGMQRGGMQRGGMQPYNDRRHSGGAGRMDSRGGYGDARGGGSALHEMTGLPNMNRMQTMGMVPSLGMGVDQRQMMMPPAQNMGYGGGSSMGYNQSSRSSYDDYGRGGSSSMEPQKTDSAINLLLGLSKMLKGGSGRDDYR